MTLGKSSTNEIILRKLVAEVCRILKHECARLIVILGIHSKRVGFKSCSILRLTDARVTYHKRSYGRA